MIVIDTSVALKWVHTEKEDDVETANSLLVDHLAAIEKIIVPGLFFYEITNALTTKTKLPRKSTAKLIKKIYSYNLEVYRPTLDDFLQTSILAKKHKTSVYDTLYAVVAKNKKTTLITADEKFIQKTGFKFVRSLKAVEIKTQTN